MTMRDVYEVFFISCLTMILVYAGVEAYAFERTGQCAVCLGEVVE